MSDRRCANCVYYDWRAGYQSSPQISTRGACRRYAPVLDGRPDEWTMHRRTTWPAVSEDDWCGEFTPTPPTNPVVTITGTSSVSAAEYERMRKAGLVSDTVPNIGGRYHTTPDSETNEPEPER